MLPFRCDARVIESAVIESAWRPTAAAPPLEEDAGGPHPSAGDCPCADDILEFCTGALPPDGSRRLRRHLEVCAVCMDLVTGAVNDWAPPEAADLLGVGTNFREGERVGGHRVERFIARGGMGEVYAAREVESGEAVALKAILATASDVAPLLRAFAREAQLARRVRHPNVCRVREPRRPSDRTEGSAVPFFTMDYIEGETLQARLRRGPLPAPDALGVAEQLLLGLRAIHEAQVLHLDIKASNVMLESDTRVVILDFGLARSTRDTERARSLRPFAGSLPYMSPEQLRGQPPSPGDDLFAFGVVLFQMLTAELPFPVAQPSATSSVHQRLAAHAPPPSALAAGVPLWLDRLVLSCLAPPEGRPAAAGEVLAALAAR